VKGGKRIRERGNGNKLGNNNWVDQTEKEGEKKKSNRRAKGGLKAKGLACSLDEGGPQKKGGTFGEGEGEVKLGGSRY